MTLWLDAHLPPSLDSWLAATFGVEVFHVRRLALRDADDHAIFFEARKRTAVVITKDADFVDLLHRHGPPPQVVWITCGNTTNARLRQLLAVHMPRVIELLTKGEDLVEIVDAVT